MQVRFEVFVRPHAGGGFEFIKLSQLCAAAIEISISSRYRRAYLNKMR